MAESRDFVDMKSCRICLTNKKPLCPLFRYKLSGNYAEMLTAIADVKVSSNDGLPDKICSKCCTSLEKAYLLRTIAERSDKILRKKLLKSNEKVPTKKIAFDSFVDIKSEIAPLTVKSEPKWEMEIEVLDTFNVPKPMDPIEGKDIVIANTVIRKVEPSLEEPKKESSDEVDLTWTKTKSNNYDVSLRIAPPEAPATGYMFGKGIYFADMVSKSANYCCTNKSSPGGVMLLAEVALGNMKECTAATYVEKLPAATHSTWGRGRTHPDPAQDHTLECGTVVPLGKPVTTVVNTSLLYNEFIVYDVAQVNVKYLLQMKFNYKY